MSRFRDMTTWFDRLSPAEQTAILSEYRAAKKKVDASDSLLPVSHGSSQSSQIRAAVDMFKSLAPPFSLVRIGDCELGLLSGGFRPENDAALSWNMSRAGFDLRSFPLRETFVDAVAGASLLGVQQNWMAHRRRTALVLEMLGLPQPLPSAVEVHLPYQLLISGDLARFLRGKRVLLVGDLAPRLRERLDSPAFRRALDQIGGFQDIDFLPAVPTPSRDLSGNGPAPSAATQYPAILARVLEKDFDVALLACGVTAKPLAWAVHQSGRTGLDVGYVFDALLGGQQSTVRPVLSSFPWKKFWAAASVPRPSPPRAASPEPTITIVIPTIGRPSLPTVLARIGAQMRPGDRIHLVSDGPSPEAEAAWSGADVPGFFHQHPKTRDSGDSQRNYGLDKATTTHVWYHDDDDLPRPDALAIIRRNAKQKPDDLLIFRMQLASGGLIWLQPGLRPNNVGSPCIVHPARPTWKLGRWHGALGGDYNFAAACAKNCPRSPVFLPDILSEIYPSRFTRRMPLHVPQEPITLRDMPALKELPGIVQSVKSISFRCRGQADITTAVNFIHKNRLWKYTADVDGVLTLYRRS